MNRLKFASAWLVLISTAMFGQQAPTAPAPAAAPAPAPVPAQTQPAQPPPTVPGGLNLNNASLLEVINLLAQDLHINYILDASVKGGTVTINTYGAVRDVDLRPLLETILRMNGLAMVQVGNMYRIIPAANIGRQPVSPISEADGAKLPDDERVVLNLVFLRYMTSAEMSKVLTPFLGDGAQMTSYDPANLLILLDNSRNMRRTLDLIAMFDSEGFAGQRVRAYTVKNGRPTDMAKELDEVFKAYSFGNEKGGAVRFIALDRINTILSVAPNPGAFAEVDKWIEKLDAPAKIVAGSVDNYVYKLKYARAENVGIVVMQLYGMPVSAAMNYGAGGYGGYSGMGGAGGVGGYGAGGYGAGGYGAAGYGGGNYSGGAYGNGGYGANAYGGYGANTYGGAGYSTMNTAPAATGGGVATTATATTAGVAGTATRDQTGTYLVAGSGYGYSGPRIIPNQFDNTLLVQGSPQQWEQIKHLLDQLDIPPRQVLIDAKIYEVDLTGEFSLGVESYLQAKTTAGSRQLTGSSNAGNSAQLALSAGTLVGQSRQLLALLSANESRTRAKVLSAPSVVATDSIPASITVGDSVPTLTSQAVAGGIQQAGSSLFTNTISNTSTGIGLNILARVNPSGVVTMVINQNVTAPVPTTTSNIDSPSFSQRNVSTQVTVEDGDTVAIGGIITESTTEASTGIPLLHRLPYIGAAFGSKNNTTQRTELIIFLTPRVIYDTTQMADATEELKEKVKGLRKVIGQNQ